MLEPLAARAGLAVWGHLERHGAAREQAQASAPSLSPVASARRSLAQ